MPTYNEAEEIFLKEIYEKKKETASLKTSQKHKRLGKGKIKFASDLMSRSEKLKHTKAGKVMTTNLYDTILAYDEFKELDVFEQRNRLAYLRANNSNKEIMKQMGLTNAAYYNLVTELGLPKATRTTAPEKTRKAIAKKTIATEEKPTPAPAATSTATQIEAPAPAPIQEVIINGLHLVFNGTFEPEMIVKQMLKFAALLEDETDDYYVELKLMQKPKKEN